MLDYTLLESLARVITLQSFEAAARALHITQSAMSQRIRTLEDQIGQPVVIRGNPLVPSPAGAKLLRHFRQVEALESEFRGMTNTSGEAEWTTVPIALNNDSLYYWFLDAVTPLLAKERLLLALSLDDEGATDHALRNGRAYAAISSRPDAPPGCESTPLGGLRYKAVATKQFRDRHFGRSIQARSLMAAPSIAFDEKDTLHQEYLAKYFGVDGVAEVPSFLVPSAKGFLTLALAGVAYGLIPDIDAGPLLKDRSLIELTPGKDMVRPLYWHAWYVQPTAYRRVTDAVVRFARKNLEHIIE